MNKFTLLADVGNTTIKLGIANERGIVHSFGFPSKSLYTADSLGFNIIQLLDLYHIEKIESVSLCSVVPELGKIFCQACKKYLHAAPKIFPEDFDIPLNNQYANPREVGADRLMGAYAARMLRPEAKSIICIDYGTATTFDCITDMDYLGGLICPGLFSSHNALATGTAKLPHITLDFDRSIPLIGKSTVTSMNHGFVFGFAAMTDGLCQKLAEQLPAPLHIVATGGYAEDIAKLSNKINTIQQDLILEGLRLASCSLLA